ncbi:hypothetical protein U1Q18_015874 [Sarracenia purpurea var. burkii]
MEGKLYTDDVEIGEEEDDVGGGDEQVDHGHGRLYWVLSSESSGGPCGTTAAPEASRDKETLRLSLFSSSLPLGFLHFRLFDSISLFDHFSPSPSLTVHSRVWNTMKGRPSFKNQEMGTRV